jgi:hypothetical protein
MADLKASLCAVHQSPNVSPFVRMVFRTSTSIPPNEVKVAEAPANGLAAVDTTDRGNTQAIGDHVGLTLGPL